MTDKCGKEIKEGEIVEVVFYSYWEPLCGAFYKMVDGDLKYISGEIPKDYYTSEISYERYLEEEVNGTKN